MGALNEAGLHRETRMSLGLWPEQRAESPGEAEPWAKGPEGLKVGLEEGGRVEGGAV